MISCISKVTRSVETLTDCKPLGHISRVRVSSNELCSSTLYLPAPHTSTFLLLSQALLMHGSEAGRWQLLSTRAGIDLGRYRLLHFASTDELSDNCSSQET